MSALLSSPMLLLVLPGLPLLLAGALIIARSRHLALILAPWIALPALLIALFSSPGLTLELPWLLLGTHFSLDETGRFFLLFSAFIWLCAGVYSCAYFADQAVRRRFLIWFLFAMSGNLGLIISHDLVSYYTFFALMSFASYGLVIFEPNAQTIRAGRIYLIMVIVGELMLFSGFVMAAMLTGSHEFAVLRPALASVELQHWIIGLIVFGFGVKSALLGLHIWLPLAYPAAPSPASAVLSGAMISAGFLGWLRILPLGEISLPGWGSLLLLMGSVSVIYALLVGLLQNDPKKVLAYSSVGKMGLLTILFGLGMIAPQHWPQIMISILFFSLYHGLAKGALFLGEGLYAKLSAERVRQRYWALLGLLLPALSLAGAPLTSGMMAKKMLSLQIASVDSFWDEGLSLVLILSSLSASLLMLHFLFLLWSERSKSRADSQSACQSDTLWMWLAWLLLLAAVALTSRFPPIELNASLSSSEIPGALWPPLVAFILIAFYHWRFPQLFRLQFDGLIHIEKRVSLVLRAISSFSMTILPQWSALSVSVFNGILVKERYSLILSKMEQQLRQWSMALSLLLLLAFVMAAAICSF